MNLVEGLRTEQESYLREGSAVEGNLEEAGEIEGKGLSGWDELMERWGVVLVSFLYFILVLFIVFEGAWEWLEM